MFYSGFSYNLRTYQHIAISVQDKSLKPVIDRAVRTVNEVGDEPFGDWPFGGLVSRGPPEKYVVCRYDGT